MALGGFRRCLEGLMLHSDTEKFITIIVIAITLVLLGSGVFVGWLLWA